MSLNGKVAVVTGGASGIGRAICLQLAKDGAAVSVWDLDESGANETVAMIAKDGGRAIACIGDAADAAKIGSNADRTRAELGPITILVNNAGITAFERFLEITPEKLERMLRINTMGPFLCAQAMIPDMLAAGWGRIVNISSSSAQTGAAMMTHYATSKGGVIALTKALAREYASKGITVNNIPPGFVDTPMLRKSPVDIDKQASSENSPMGRAGKPEDIAAACSYLVSEAAAYVTGHTLGVNGGRVMP
jgi:2-hydroxycyclohexanecarboxyl-CoA dehydrogenase